jgi:hypothetical protein
MGVALGGGRGILKGKGDLCNNSDQMVDDEGSPAEELSGAVKKISAAIGRTMLNALDFSLKMIFISFFYFE